jgi:hypothetical protein
MEKDGVFMSTLDSIMNSNEDLYGIHKGTER